MKLLSKLKPNEKSQNMETYNSGSLPRHNNTTHKKLKLRDLRKIN